MSANPKNVGSSRIDLPEGLKLAPETPPEEVLLMEQDAFRHWTERVPGAFPRRAYLPDNHVEKFRDALGRPMTLAELNLLVGIDGEENSARCSWPDCGKSFTPLWWVQPFQLLLDEIRHGGDIEAAFGEIGDKVMRFGAFHPNSESLLDPPRAFCGSPYFFYKDTGKTVQARSHLGRSKLAHPQNYWGRSMASIEKIRDDVRERSEEHQRKVAAERRSRAQMEEEQVAAMFRRGNSGPQDRLVMKEPAIPTARTAVGGGVMKPKQA